jgi:ribonuclease E
MTEQAFSGGSTSPSAGGQAATTRQFEPSAEPRDAFSAPADATAGDSAGTRDDRPRRRRGRRGRGRRGHGHGSGVGPAAHDAEPRHGRARRPGDGFESGAAVASGSAGDAPAAEPFETDLPELPEGAALLSTGVEERAEAGPARGGHAAPDQRAAPGGGGRRNRRGGRGRRGRRGQAEAENRGDRRFAGHGRPRDVQGAQGALPGVRDRAPDEPDSLGARGAPPAGGFDALAAPEAVDPSAAPAGRRRRRGARGGRRRRGGEPGHAAERPADGPLHLEILPGEDDELAEIERAGATQRGVAAAAAAAAPARPAPARDQTILVNASDAAETRVAVVEGNRIVDLWLTTERSRSLVNDIYRARVVNLEEAIGAAFLDFGMGRNGFLHTSDVMPVYGSPDWSLDKLLTARISEEEWEGGRSEEDAAAREPAAAAEPESTDAEAPPAPAPDVEREPERRRETRRGRDGRPRLPISELMKKGQLTVVQVTKDAIGDKGPTLTTYISIPGRYLVLIPLAEFRRVSRKIPDERERRRLRKALEALRVPPGIAVIVRTAGVGQSQEDLQRDLDYLLAQWADFESRLGKGAHPTLLYKESDVATRTMRDLFSERTEKVVTDDREVWEAMREFARAVMPEHEDKILLEEGERPLFHAYGVEQDFERIFARRVELPSGGSVVFDQAEALVAIDVNSGRTREVGASFEEIALKTNLEAAPEIARQIRMRDLGGIVVVDFIDMMKSSNRRQVERAFRDALAMDRARFKLGRISQFGLLELTRQRLGPGISKLLYDACPHCRGSGRVRNTESRAQGLVRRLTQALTQKGFAAIEVRVRPEILEALEQHCKTAVEQLRAAHPRGFHFVAVADQPEDHVLRYLRADGKEVRPGGRRKR